MRQRVDSSSSFALFASPKGHRYIRTPLRISRGEFELLFGGEGALTDIRLPSKSLYLSRGVGGSRAGLYLGTNSRNAM